MRKTALLLLALLTLLAVPSLMAAESQTLEGEFVWERSDKNYSGPLKAIFEPTEEEGTWNVAFHFTFEEKAHVYSGTAKGNLKDGELSGEVMTDDDEPAPFLFEGQFDNGKFKGTHAGIRDGEKRPTGTLSLSR